MFWFIASASFSGKIRSLVDLGNWELIGPVATLLTFAFLVYYHRSR